jgi:hypothetical protein
MFYITRYTNIAIFFVLSTERGNNRQPIQVPEFFGWPASSGWEVDLWHLPLLSRIYTQLFNSRLHGALYTVDDTHQAPIFQPCHILRTFVPGTLVFDATYIKER